MIAISALKGFDTDTFLKPILEILPEGMPFFEADQITDLNTRFFVGEIIQRDINEYENEFF